jgi:hypothetical protein
LPFNRELVLMIPIATRQDVCSHIRD